LSHRPVLPLSPARARPTLPSLPTRRSSDLDGGVGVDDDVILQRRMAFHAADDVAGGVAREAQGAEGDALIQLDVLADVARFADEDWKSTRLNSSHQISSYAVFCMRKKNRQS